MFTDLLMLLLLVHLFSLCNCIYKKSIDEIIYPKHLSESFTSSIFNYTCASVQCHSSSLLKNSIFHMIVGMYLMNISYPKTFHIFIPNISRLDTSFTNDFYQKQRFHHLYLRTGTESENSATMIVYRLCEAFQKCIPRENIHLILHR